MLRDVCAQRAYPATLVVGNASEVAAVVAKRPCDGAAVVALDRRRLNLREDGSIYPARLFKVRAIAAFSGTYPDGTLLPAAAPKSPVSKKFHVGRLGGISTSWPRRRRDPASALRGKVPRQRHQSQIAHARQPLRDV